MTAKTDMDRLAYDVSVKLEKIVGVSVYHVAYAEPDGLLIRRRGDRA